jgi:hypothetical protein
MSSDAPGTGVALTIGSGLVVLVSMLTTAGSTRLASSANDVCPGCANDEAAPTITKANAELILRIERLERI